MSGCLTLAWLTDPWTYGLVLIVALLLFGKRLPEVGRSLGKGIAEFKKGLHDVSDEFTKADDKEEQPRQRLQPPQTESAPPPRAIPTETPAHAEPEKPPAEVK